MSDINLYVGEHWCPFPCSEYGGLWVVTAENEEQVCELLLKEYGDYDGAEQQYEHLIPEAVAKAEVFALDTSKLFPSDVPRIVLGSLKYFSLRISYELYCQTKPV